MINAEQILLSTDTQELEKVLVPEWDGHVFVRIMSGSERDRWELSQMDLIKSPGAVNIRAGLCIMTVCDEKGERLFDDSQAVALGKKSAVALDRIFDVARRVNKLTDGDIEELEKN